MNWIVGWPLLILSLFIDDPFREQILAAQTIVCALVQKRKTFHLATLVFIVCYFTQPPVHEHPSYVLIIHHLVIIGAIVSPYLIPNYQFFTWVIMAWSIRWLGSISLFETPFRTSTKCLLYVVIVRGNWGMKSTQLAHKWCWILFVHEVMWCFLPIQILYEVYAFRKKKVDNINIV